MDALVEIEYPETERDLSMIACYAAMELQNLLGGNAQTLRAVPALVVSILKRLDSNLDQSSTKHLLDPSTAVFMHQALVQAGWAGPHRNTQDLLTELRNVIRQLSELAIKNRDTNKEVLSKLRDFCLAVSKRAIAELPSPYPYESQPTLEVSV